MKNNMKQYKAFDFKSGNTYLIGEFDSKVDAEAYCRTQGYITIPQTVVALTEDEYRTALAHRKGAQRPKLRLRRGDCE